MTVGRITFGPPAPAINFTGAGAAWAASSAPMTMPQQCGHCGMIHGLVCPRVKAIEYYPDGTVKRVEYHVGND